MGIKVNADKNEVSTCPHFPKDINDVKLSSLRFGENTVDIKLERNKAVLSNIGKKAVHYKCRFVSDEEYFNVNGEKTKAEKETENGVNISYVHIEVGPNSNVIIEL